MELMAAMFVDNGAEVGWRKCYCMTTRHDAYHRHRQSVPLDGLTGGDAWSEEMYAHEMLAIGYRITLVSSSNPIRNLDQIRLKGHLDE